jgi:acyl dehydratase
MSGPDLSKFVPVVKGHLFEDFQPGRVFVHHWGRTITDGDNAIFYRDLQLESDVPQC